MNKKTESLTISLTMEEKQFINSIAESRYLPVSDFIVLSVLACSPEAYGSIDDSEDSPTMSLKVDRSFIGKIN